MCVVLVCVCASHLEMNSCGMYGSIPINMWNLVQLEYVPPPLCCPRDLVPVVCEWLLRARVCVCVYARARYQCCRVWQMADNRLVGTLPNVADQLLNLK